jgi:hypothetical protein
VLDARLQTSGMTKIKKAVNTQTLINNGLVTWRDFDNRIIDLVHDFIYSYGSDPVQAGQKTHFRAKSKKSRAKA